MQSIPMPLLGEGQGVGLVFLAMPRDACDMTITKVFEIIAVN
jgi:hypothetical protein